MSDSIDKLVVPTLAIVNTRQFSILTALTIDKNRRRRVSMNIGNAGLVEDKCDNIKVSITAFPTKSPYRGHKFTNESGRVGWTEVSVQSGFACELC